ncbi:YeeE/YedE family protein [Thecamonas trahens ATCC 50062]|uniref:YeeE/YedE family protein n=1 Tax=Thecamonas trahens ATCC 50062 TaxID=461836 RepID=A0A0L0DUJ2_THETB|nr:YeeE/YedE family protein [Thecamonas trahens ATCC 50062]KNC55133.1 YeeE/YedE family protein [Thecamonas trahens ATCC 50062]|eukprot:XP_013753313.1 YeeE/YedE family protein [Thecamonas trahens ATCC 50062]
MKDIAPPLADPTTSPTQQPSDSPTRVNEAAKSTASSNGCNAQDATWSWLIAFAVSLLAGFAFGFAMQKSWAFDPFIVRRQFAFANWIMIKVFAAAGASTAFVLVAVSYLAPTAFAAVMDGAYTNDRGMVSAFVGGALIGVGGFVIAGSCPGTVFSQLGAGVLTSPLTFAGAIVGTLVYGLVHPYLTGEARTAKASIYFGVPYPAIAASLGTIFLLLVIVLEIVVPANNDLPAGTTVEHDWVLAKRAWPAWASGLVLGSIQIPLILVLHKTLGTSTALVAFISTFLSLLPAAALDKPSLAYFKGKHIGRRPGYTLIFALAAVIGSLSSAYFGDSFAELHGVHPAGAFFGGALMLFGARLGGGCTSGHGISGTAKLQWASFASFAGMFGCAVPLGLLWEYA